MSWGLSDDVLTNAIAAKNRQLEEENARLKELNREMVEAIKRVCKGMCDHEYHKAVGLCEDCVVDSALRKARGE